MCTNIGVNAFNRLVQMIMVHENGFTEIKSSVDTDEMPPFVASQLGLHCLLKSNFQECFQTGNSVLDKASFNF